MARLGWERGIGGDVAPHPQPLSPQRGEGSQIFYRLEAPLHVKTRGCIPVAAARLGRRFGVAGLPWAYTGPDRPPPQAISAEPGRFQVVIGLNDLPEPVLQAAVAAVGVGMQPFYSSL